jgi:uncharacterized protein
MVYKIYNKYTNFEFDLEKSSGNKRKHGIDFNEAQVLWNDTDLLEIPLTTTDEPRYVIIAKIAGKHWSAIVTYRGDNIRIISVRRSRKEEIALYEGT